MGQLRQPSVHSKQTMIEYTHELLSFTREGQLCNALLHGGLFALNLLQAAAFTECVFLFLLEQDLNQTEKIRTQYHAVHAC